MNNSRRKSHILDVMLARKCFGSFYWPRCAFCLVCPTSLAVLRKGREERGVTEELHAGKTRVAEHPSGSGTECWLLSPLNSLCNPLLYLLTGSCSGLCCCLLFRVFPPLPTVFTVRTFCLQRGAAELNRTLTNHWHNTTLTRQQSSRHLSWDKVTPQLNPNFCRSLNAMLVRFSSWAANCLKVQ